MENIRRVNADAYVLACDYASEASLSPLAASCGFLCVAGPKEDVLARFCLVIKKTGATTVLRATGDNPWLFADAAERSLERFAELQSGSTPPDYFTWSGLPHGSGIEVFSARRLLEAAALTDSSYDHEHVGPALYNHPDRFVAVREPAPAEWQYPDMRTTIDTRDDYDRACLMAEYLQYRNIPIPASSAQVIEAWNYVSRPVLFIPSTEPGQGTGHIKRMASLVADLGREWRCVMYVPLYSPFIALIPEAVRPNLVHMLPESAHLVVIDRFRSTHQDIRDFRKIGPVIAFDEGGDGRGSVDYLLDIIPGIPGSLCKPNMADSTFLPLPKHRRKKTVSDISSVLVVAGGENAVGYALPTAQIFADMDLEVTVIDPSSKGVSKHENGFRVSGPVPNLRESLCHYDLVVTHYGFTAFEALAAGCKVILFSPSCYHYRLAVANGFSALPYGPPKFENFRKLLEAGIALPAVITPATIQKSLPDEIRRLISRKSLCCPLCGSSGGTIIAREVDRTVRHCAECGMDYPSLLVVPGQSYSRSYFFEEYRRQYGKTYLEDFETIKQQGFRRLLVLRSVLSGRYDKGDGEKRLLDIGCAYGPFLAAARDSGWSPAGTDISADAIDYVRATLKIPAIVSAFPAPDAEGLLDRQRFDAVTLWYVIEHFEDLEPVFGRIRKLLRAGGVLAFSTPSASGVSGRFSREAFFRNSPRDHYTIWNPRNVRRQLARYGFTVARVVSTGHHPERFPFMQGKKPGGFLWNLCARVSRVFFLGDTFEVYAIKNGQLEDDAE
jgi:spore coat polysaccharide biosynthesis protein SpsF (cytidylyltransferase family)/2-polyprenyl-3-methyl-5-hydroxy-6-metoxy-1,4-benzoquinol methylase